jgi:TolB-like protein
VSRSAPSIAVLPFVSTSGNADDEPFTDGLTDDLIAALGRVPALTVRPRTSSFALKGKNLAARTIADTLHVNYVVEGTVRRDQERLKVATQLVDARDEPGAVVGEPTIVIAATSSPFRNRSRVPSRPRCRFV